MRLSAIANTFTLLSCVLLTLGLGSNGRADRFVKVADFPNYATWGAANWNGRIYVGFYTEPHGKDLPLYRTGVNDDKFTFVRNLGSGESMPEIFVSPDGSTLHATTEGYSGTRQSPGMHWWTTDSANALDWKSESFSQKTEYRWGIASLVHNKDMFMAFSGGKVGAKVLKHENGTWKQFGPLVTPEDDCIVLELEVFKGRFYAAGGTGRYQQPDCTRLFRLNASSDKWESVFPHKDGLIACAAVFDGKLWVGTVWGTKVYCSSNGTDWDVAYDFKMKGSWPGPDTMIVYKNKLYVASGDSDKRIKIAARPAGGQFSEVFSSDQYRTIGQFIIRGSDLYALGGKTGGGGMALKLVSDPTGKP